MWPSQCNVLCDGTFEAPQTGPLLELERADVQRRWAEPARHSMYYVNVGIWKCFVEMIAWLKNPFIFIILSAVTLYRI